MRTFVAGKIHGLIVTAKSLAYHGSAGVSRDLMDQAGMSPYEQVDCVNLSTGARWTTYLLPLDEPGQLTLNGGAARLGEVGDRCLLMTYRQEQAFTGALVVMVGPTNRDVSTLRYPPG